MEKKIAALIQPTLKGMGYDLVRVLIHGKGRRILQVMAERHDSAAIGVEDCARLSRAVSAVLDVEDPIHGPYVLEVSSPGLERPLTKTGDFARFAGYETRLETWRSITGRRRFRGRLLGLSAAGEVRLALCEGGEVVIPQAEVAKAKLMCPEPFAQQGSKRDSTRRAHHSHAKNQNTKTRKREDVSRTETKRVGHT